MMQTVLGSCHLNVNLNVTSEMYSYSMLLKLQPTHGHHRGCLFNLSQRMSGVLLPH